MGFSLPAPAFLFDKLDEFGLELAEQDKLVEAGVASVGKPAAYAPVWEWGNARQQKKGPRTTRGINPDGTVVWLTIQRPHGYIAIYQSVFQMAFDDELDKVEFEGASTGQVSDALRRAANNTAKRIAQIMEATAPVGLGPGAGALARSFEVVEAGDYATLDSGGDRVLNLIGGGDDGDS